jgi:hypothetical protein
MPEHVDWQVVSTSGGSATVGQKSEPRHPRSEQSGNRVYEVNRNESETPHPSLVGHCSQCSDMAENENGPFGWRTTACVDSAGHTTSNTRDEISRTAHQLKTDRLLIREVVRTN